MPAPLAYCMQMEARRREIRKQAKADEEFDLDECDSDGNYDD